MNYIFTFYLKTWDHEYTFSVTPYSYFLHVYWNLVSTSSGFLTKIFMSYIMSFGTSLNMSFNIGLPMPPMILLSLWIWDFFHRSNTHYSWVSFLILKCFIQNFPHVNDWLWLLILNWFCKNLICILMISNEDLVIFSWWLTWIFPRRIQIRKA